MAEVTKYHILVYGAPDGYQTNRAQISLYGAAGNVIAYIRFNDPGMFFEADYETGGIIKDAFAIRHVPKCSRHSSKRKANTDIFRSRSRLPRHAIHGACWRRRMIEPNFRLERDAATTPPPSTGPFGAKLR